MSKLNLGCGEEILDGYTNVDLLDLEGVDVVHNLMQFPYPFKDESADEIKAKDLIEHLPSYVPFRLDVDETSLDMEIGKRIEVEDVLVVGQRNGQPTVIAFIEECHRILKPGGTLWIQTPRFDAEFLWIDPTHVRGFHERSMEFFDPDQDFGKSTGFYSHAKFKVKSEVTENKNLIFTMVKL